MTFRTSFSSEACAVPAPRQNTTAIVKANTCRPKPDFLFLVQIFISFFFIRIVLFFEVRCCCNLFHLRPVIKKPRHHSERRNYKRGVEVAPPKEKARHYNGDTGQDHP